LFLVSVQFFFLVFMQSLVETEDEDEVYLPDEIMRRIFKFMRLSNVEMASLGDVCPRWRELVACGGWDVWCRLDLLGHHDIVNDLSLTYRGDRLASASNDGTVRVWRLEDYAGCVRFWRMPDRPARFVRFDAAGEILVVSEGGDRPVKVFAVDSGACILTVHGRPEWQNLQWSTLEQGWAESLSLTRDGSRVALVSYDAVTRVLSLDDGHLIAEYGTADNGGLASAAISPGGDVVLGTNLTSYNEYSVFRLDFSSSDVPLTAHQQQPPRQLPVGMVRAISNNSQQVLIESNDGIRLVHMNSSPDDEVGYEEHENQEEQTLPNAQDYVAMFHGVDGHEEDHLSSNEFMNALDNSAWVETTASLNPTTTTTTSTTTRLRKSGRDLFRPRHSRAFYKVVDVAMDECGRRVAFAKVFVVRNKLYGELEVWDVASMQEVAHYEVIQPEESLETKVVLSGDGRTLSWTWGSGLVIQAWQLPELPDR